MPELVPVEHNPFQKMVPVDHDPFKAAAARTQQSVRPEGGRQEGTATKVLAGYVPNALDDMAHLPERAFGASEQLRATGEYDPGPAMETALLTLGAGTAFAPKGAVGMAGSHFYFYCFCTICFSHSLY